MNPEPSHIRPEIKREVDSYLDLRTQIRSAEKQLRALFTARMAREGLTATELAMVAEAIERTE